MANESSFQFRVMVRHFDGHEYQDSQETSLEYAEARVEQLRNIFANDGAIIESDGSLESRQAWIEVREVSPFARVYGAVLNITNYEGGHREPSELVGSSVGISGARGVDVGDTAIAKVGFGDKDNPFVGPRYLVRVTAQYMIGGGYAEAQVLAVL